MTQIINCTAGADRCRAALSMSAALPWVGLRRSKWANPFRIGRDGIRNEMIARHRDWLLQQPELMAALPELRGKDLACWCASEPCHAEVLRELANG